MSPALTKAPPARAGGGGGHIQAPLPLWAPRPEQEASGRGGSRGALGSLSHQGRQRRGWGVPGSAKLLAQSSSGAATPGSPRDQCWSCPCTPEQGHSSTTGQQNGGTRGSPSSVPGAVTTSNASSLRARPSHRVSIDPGLNAIITERQCQVQSRRCPQPPASSTRAGARPCLAAGSHTQPAALETLGQGLRARRSPSPPPAAHLQRKEGEGQEESPGRAGPSQPPAHDSLQPSAPDPARATFQGSLCAHSPSSCPASEDTTTEHSSKARPGQSLPFHQEGTH